MKEAILIIVILGVFVCGFFLMKKLDKFLEENRKSIQKESEKREPSCVMLTEELSDEEVVEEVLRYRSKHEGARIMLYDSADLELSKNIEHQTALKQ